MSATAAADAGVSARGGDYSHPSRRCDIVMKGGITSGVVYPLAVCELARTYQFRSIGGTSAGAIAAAATAAAEYGRHRPTGGFAELETLPTWLGAPAPDGRTSNLFALFQPGPATKALFDTLAAALGPSTGRLGRVALAGPRAFPLAALLGAVPGLILAALAIGGGGGWLLAWALAMALLLIVAGATVGVLAAFVRRAIRALPANGFGLCSGYAAPMAGRAAPLTTWLADLLDRLAGRSAGDAPLTFGDLWGTTDPTAERTIDLQMMTTNLTHGRPYRLPFEENVFYFDPAEFRRLFPERIVDWLERRPRPNDDLTRSTPLRPLPLAADLPVVVAARLSLSFPFLLSAVPLYAIDYSRPIPATERRPEVCWFSDGGIASNFPVHFFDQPLPRWPTFAINLRAFHPDYERVPDEAQKVRMVESNLDGLTEWWTRLDPRPGVGQLAGFASAILGTMQNWTDNTQLRLPGYRDRVVHISLAADEGGLNLNMPPRRIAVLAERGRLAGAKLVQRFTAPAAAGEVSWDNHRWVRYRTSMALLEDLLRRLGARYRSPMPGDRSYAELVRRSPADPPRGYPWRQAGQRDFAAAATDDVVDMVEQWAASGQTFGDGAPRPAPELRIRPRI